MCRCASCDVVLTESEMMLDLPNGQMNDICWICQGIIDNPESCVRHSFQFEEITEIPVPFTVTPDKPIYY